MITILFLASNPHDTPRLALDEEVRSIDERLRRAEFRDVFEIKQHWAVRISDLQEIFLRHKPTIVHFSGHGITTSGIILQDDSGKNRPVPSRALSSLFSVLREEIRCVVLNACYSKKQAEAIAEHIDCVVGMTNAISDLAAISFASAFYQALGYGQSVKTAFDLGCGQIHMEELGEHETPILLSPKVDPSSITFRPPHDQDILQQMKRPLCAEFSNATKQFAKLQLRKFIYCRQCGAALGESTRCPYHSSHSFGEAKPDTGFIYCQRCGLVPGEPTKCPNYSSHSFVELSQSSA